jgi:hypothetical protein
MRWIARDAATTIATLIAIATVALLGTVSLGANAADLGYPPPTVGSYPPPVVGQPQYGMASPPAVAPPQVIVIPGQQVMPSSNMAAPIPPPVPPPLLPRLGVAPGPPISPRAACDPVWRCGDRGCGWSPGCAPYPEIYSDRYGPPGMQQDHPYPESPPTAERYPGRYAYPEAPPPPEIYSGR